MLELYKNIKKYRKELKMSQDELAKRVGYKDRSSIAKIESGSVNLSQKKIIEFAKIFGVTPGTLMGNDGIEDPYKYENIEPISTKKIPVYDGIACGKPRIIDNDIEFYTATTSNIHADFALIAHGESMIGARIHDGDFVFVREQPIVENGQIAAVVIGDEATLKRFYKYGDTVVLRPENPLYEEMVFSGEDISQIHVLGLAIAFQSAIQ